MKKLEKLTLIEMSNKIQLLSIKDQSSFTGGTNPTYFSSAQDVWYYCWGEVADEFSPITNAVGSALNSIQEAANDFANWVEDNNILEIAGAAGIAAADIYLWWLGTAPTTGGMPIYYGSDSHYGSFN